MQMNKINLHIFPFSFNFTIPYLPGSEQFWINDYKNCYCALVCVCYDQNDPLVIVTQLKREECVDRFDNLSQFFILIQHYRMIFVWM